MNPRRTLFLAWFVTGGGAMMGSILGNWFHGPGLFVGAFIGGAAAVALSAIGAVRGREV